jgi:hypothetical protein
MLKLMRAEAQAFHRTCRSAIDKTLFASSDVSRLAALIAQGFSQNRARWTVWTSCTEADAIISYYLNVAGMPELIRLHAENMQVQGWQGVPAPPIDVNTYLTLIHVTANFLNTIDVELRLRARLEYCFAQFRSFV